MIETATGPARDLIARYVAPRERWLVPLVLALPFLVMIAVLKGMTVTLLIFHGSDERVLQIPTIMHFRHQLPFPNLHRYPAAQTPLFHLILAYAGQVTGYATWTLRLFEVAFSYLLILAVYGLLRRRLRLPLEQAFALTMLFEISPYIFGQSFRVVTDNFADLWIVIAVDWLERYRTSRSLRAYLVASAAVSAGILTRQSTTFLVPLAGAYAVNPWMTATLRERALALAGLGLCLVPPLALFVDWHGLIPVGSYPGSCGLCAQGKGSYGVSASSLETQTTQLALATIGIYGVVLFAPDWLQSLARRGTLRGLKPAEWQLPVACAVLGLLFLIACPARPGTRGAGDLWDIAGHLPTIDGSSLLFWVCVPLSGAVLADRVRRAPDRFLVLAFALTYLISTVLIRNTWQKYVDPFALLILFMTVVPGELRGRRIAGVLVLGALFIVYAADYSSHQSTAPPQTAYAAPARPVPAGAPQLVLPRARRIT